MRGKWLWASSLGSLVISRVARSPGSVGLAENRDAYGFQEVPESIPLSIPGGEYATSTWCLNSDTCTWALTACQALGWIIIEIVLAPSCGGFILQRKKLVTPHLQHKLDRRRCKVGDGATNLVQKDPESLLLWNLKNEWELAEHSQGKMWVGVLWCWAWGLGTRKRPSKADRCDF